MSVDGKFRIKIKYLQQLYHIPARYQHIEYLVLQKKKKRILEALSNHPEKNVA